MKSQINCVPVVIPTCNRIIHLKRCIESLRKCSLANQTDIIISVDYPPNEKYVEGYNEICNWLKSGINGFKSVKIIYQEKNIGAYQNYLFLSDYAANKYDGFIFTEDDNEVSPCFLEFVNKCLQLSIYDDRVVSVSGFCALSNYHSIKNNISYVKKNSCWGVGYASSKWVKIREIINDEYIKKIIKSRKLSKRLINTSKMRFVQLVYYALDDLKGCSDTGAIVIDIFISIYEAIENKYQIQPHISMIRNWGNDGSGVNSPNLDEDALNFIIDEGVDFEINYCKEYDLRDLDNKQLYKDDENVYSKKVVNRFIIFAEIYRLIGKEKAKTLYKGWNKILEVWEISKIRRIYKKMKSK